MRTILITLSILVIFPSWANDPSLTVEEPAPGLPIYNYRIDNCPGILGFGKLYYSNDYATKSISDICILEQEGRVLGAEPLERLELTKKGRNGRAYEDLASGSSDYDRNSIKILPDENAPGCVQETVESFHLLRKDTPVSNSSNAGTSFMIGYTIPATAPLPKAKTAEIWFGLRDISRGRIDGDTAKMGTFEPSNDFGDFIGKAQFSDSGGEITLEEGGGYQYGDVSGKLLVQFDNLGGFTLEGSFSAKNLRLAGFEPGEFKQLSGDLLRFRGHILGSDGAEMLGYGLARGVVVDEAGKSHDFLATAYIISCMSDAK
ncbi:MAG: hypothetical protein COA52_17050 [Hyphomicrobiales bacterium]|nr:hypothetical protein [Hyphomicrobiales bacterium]PCJ84730.1 MAG: hypothetical protein COA52_17050 [Hyphomicrobiales bacterium]